MSQRSTSNHCWLKFAWPNMITNNLLARIFKWELLGNNVQCVQKSKSNSSLTSKSKYIEWWKLEVAYVVVMIVVVVQVGGLWRLHFSPVLTLAFKWKQQPSRFLVHEKCEELENIARLPRVLVPWPRKNRLNSSVVAASEDESERARKRAASSFGCWYSTRTSMRPNQPRWWKPLSTVEEAMYRVETEGKLEMNRI